MSSSHVIRMYVHVPLRLCFFQAEDGIRDLVRSRGLGDVYKRQLIALKRRVLKPRYARSK